MVRIRPTAVSHVRAGRRRATVILLAGGLALMATACGAMSSAADRGSSTAPARPLTVTDYVAGHWVPFSSTTTLSPAQWSVVDAYANFSSAALAVYTTRSVAALATVVSPQSQVISMFTRDLAAGINPESLYIRVTVESVAIHGCRASLTLELFYPGGRSLHYVSSWVRPFDRAGLDPHLPGLGRGATSPTRAVRQYAPWQFVGDNRVGGVDTPCGI